MKKIKKKKNMEKVLEFGGKNHERKKFSDMMRLLSGSNTRIYLWISSWVSKLYFTTPLFFAARYNPVINFRVTHSNLSSGLVYILAWRCL